METRKITMYLGTFQVRIPLKEYPTPEQVFLSRNIVNDVFNHAPQEYMEVNTIMNRPITPGTLITNIRVGSINLRFCYAH